MGAGKIFHDHNPAEAWDEVLHYSKNPAPANYTQVGGQATFRWGPYVEGVDAIGNEDIFDWQVADWCLPLVPGPDGKRVGNPLSMLNRWKVFDNLRRSLVPASLLVFLLFASPPARGRHML